MSSSRNNSLGGGRGNSWAMERMKEKDEEVIVNVEHGAILEITVCILESPLNQHAPCSGAELRILNQCLVVIGAAQPSQH